MSAGEIDIQQVANLARLHLSEEEKTRFGAQLGNILHYIEKLRALDVESIEPTAHAVPLFDVLREDHARPGFSTSEALSNAPQKTFDQFLVTKVVD